MRQVTDLLVGGRSYRLQRNGREASKSSRVFNELVPEKHDKLLTSSGR